MTKNKIEEGQIVLCTVEKVIGTSVFVKIEDHDATGSISFPEVAPGRIRNIRDYVFPGKKIVCKVLKIHSDSIELSLRRVKVSEKNELNEKYKKEKTYSAILKTILQAKSDEIIKKIRDSETSLLDFLENSKENPKVLEKYCTKEESDKILKILKEKSEKTKEATISKNFSLSSKDSNGINIVKTIIHEASKGTNCEFFYMAAGKYNIKLRSKNPKQADSIINQVLDKIEDLSKKKYCSSCSFTFNK